jgi:hypothetical protein
MVFRKAGPRVRSKRKQMTAEDVGEPARLSTEALSGFALIGSLRGSLKGRTSSMKALQRQRRREDRIRDQKLGAKFR